jgi:hypothetical protein
MAKKTHVLASVAQTAIVCPAGSTGLGVPSHGEHFLPYKRRSVSNPFLRYGPFFVLGLIFKFTFNHEGVTFAKI